MLQLYCIKTGRHLFNFKCCGTADIDRKLDANVIGVNARVTRNSAEQ